MPTEIPSNLLWRAFPDGYFKAGGHLTVGGFICMGYLRDGPQRGWHFRRIDGPLAIVSDEKDWTPEHTRALAEMVGESGDDLLPAVDPNIPANWGVLVFTLAVLLGRDPTYMYSFGPGLDREPGEWALGPQGSGTYNRFFFEIDGEPVTDYTLALVCAFIQAREGTTP